MSQRIQGIGPNPKQLHFLVQLPDYGVERVSHVTTCHQEPSPEHEHPVMQLLWILSGELNMEIGAQMYYLKPGSVAILPAGLLHRPEASPAHPVVEMLDLRILPPLSSYVESRHASFLARFSRKALKARVAAIHKLASDGRRPDPAKVLACTWDILQLASQRASKRETPLIPNEPAEDVRIYAAEAIMRLYIGKPLSMPELAGQVNLSVTHLTRLFRQVRHAGPGTVFRRIRMERARELLIGSCLSVKEIGRECGFSGFNQFVRAFGSMFGVSPGMYRKKAQTRKHT